MGKMKLESTDKTEHSTNSENKPVGKLWNRRGGLLITGVVIIIIIIIVLAVFRWGLGTRSTQAPVTLEQLKELPLDGISKMMVVAHPDDETFWGGAHLSQEPYLVVCLTCGCNEVRRKEFEQAVRLAGSVPLILNYPDKELGIRSRWTGYRDDIEKDLEVLFAFRNWEMVVTHNPDGEYGHIHHRKTSSMVTGEARNYPETSLYYFGTYHTAKELADLEDNGNTPEKVSEASYAVKEQMIDLYQSQGKVADEFGHMFPYEEWYPAK